jgi:hypothetical protein
MRYSPMAARSARGDWCTFEYLLRLVLTHSPKMLMHSVMAHRVLLCATKAGSFLRYEKGIRTGASGLAGLPPAPPLQRSAVAITKAEVRVDAFRETADAEES